jgi:F-type H+-transporting ATPase subunit delta
MAHKKDNKLAKRLAQLVIEAGEKRLPELRPALESILKGKSAKDRKTFLKAFHKAVVREIDKDTLTVESAKALSPEIVQQLVSKFSFDRSRPLIVLETINPDLIAGMKVRLGDTVYDASLANNLQTLASRIH